MELAQAIVGWPRVEPPIPIAALGEVLASWSGQGDLLEALAAAEPASMPLLLETLRTSRENEAKIAGLVDALSATLASRILGVDVNSGRNK